MASRTLLEIIQAAAVECGLDAPDTVISNADPNAVLLLGLANKAGRLIAKRHDWQGLEIQHTWTSAASAAQSSGPPSQTDYDRLLYRAELWDRTNHRKYSGPTDPLDWQRLQASTVAAGVNGWWRIVGGALNVYPTLTAGYTMALPYISKSWVTLSPTGYGSVFADDDDQVRIPDNLVELYVIWAFKHKEGLDYAEDMSDYEREFERAASADRGLRARVMSSAGRDGMPATPGWTGVVS